MTITLITHNVYWFQGCPRRWSDDQRRPHPGVVEEFVRLYEELRPDVLCLQEVPSRQVVDTLQTHLDMDGHYVPGGIRTEYGGAVLWRDLEVSTQDLSRTVVCPDRVFERMCMQVQIPVQGKILNLVNVHLSSDRYAPERVGEPIRMAEVRALFSVNPGAEVIVGDFNATPDSPVHRYMEDQGLVDLGLGDEENSVDGKRIDYIWVAEKCRSAAVGYRMMTEDEIRCREAPPPAGLSDHCPVIAQLEL